MDPIVRFAAIVFLIWFAIQFPWAAAAILGICILIRVLRFAWEKIDDIIF